MFGEQVEIEANKLPEITGGFWENLPQQSLPIRCFQFARDAVEKNDIYVYWNFEYREKNNSHSAHLNDVKNRGASAAIVPLNIEIDSELPLLRVEDPTQALKDIALETTRATAATKVLVTGSFGKTGFKTQLYHLIKKQFRTSAMLDSKNVDIPIWRALASIHADAQVAIVEVAVPGRGRGSRRSRWVRPNICVITDVGLEHVGSQGKTIDDIIFNKTKVANGIQQGGNFIIPEKANLTDKIRTHIRELCDTNILVFGESDDCDAQLLSAKFNGFSWDVIARIVDTKIEYSLPLLEDYAPKSSLAVLLTAHLLGAELTSAVREYPTYRQYASSGHFYRMGTDDFSFFLYDQSKRGEMDAFKSTLRLISRLKPKPGGRKIAVLSEFTNLEEADKSLVNVEEFATLVDNANIDILFTVHLFPEHINVLKNKAIWRNHSFAIEDIIPEIVDEIGPEDMIFVRGTLKSNLSLLIEKINEKFATLETYN